MIVPLGKSSPSAQPRQATELRLAGVWKVVVLNDPVNLMSYVVLVFKKVFGFDEARARKHMLEVHEQGRSVVWIGLREPAEAYALTLQQWHLTAILESDERLEVKLSLSVVGPLIELIRGLTADLQQAPAAGAAPSASDPDFSKAWTGELIGSQSRDVTTMLSLFDADFLADGIVRFDGSNAEAIARASSALRLRLRERYLKPLGDEALESGEVEMKKLAEPQRKAFMCYLFLATIQELIIQHLDDSIIG